MAEQSKTNYFFGQTGSRLTPAAYRWRQLCYTAVAVGYADGFLDHGPVTQPTGRAWVHWISRAIDPTESYSIFDVFASFVESAHCQHKIIFFRIVKARIQGNGHVCIQKIPCRHTCFSGSSCRATDRSTQICSHAQTLVSCDRARCCRRTKADRA